MTSTGKGATWLFYIIVGALLVIVGLSMFVLVAWRKVDGDHGCMLCRLLLSVVERYFHRKAETSHRHIQPTPAAEERSRLRSAQRADVEPAVMGSVRLTVPTVPDLPPSTVPPSTTTTSDGGSSEQPAAESGKTTSTDID